MASWLNGRPRHELFCSCTKIEERFAIEEVKVVQVVLGVPGGLGRRFGRHGEREFHESCQEWSFLCVARGWGGIGCGKWCFDTQRVTVRKGGAYGVRGRA